MKSAAIITIAILGALTVALAPAAAALGSDHAGRCDKGTIVFTRFADDGTLNLFSTSACGGATTQVTTTGAPPRRISPDGRRLAYDSVPPGQSATDVFVANGDGSHARDITNAPGTDDIQPDLSPDGRQVAYSSATDGVRDARIVVQDLGSGQTRDHAGDPGPGGARPELVALGPLIAFDTFDPAAGASYIWVVRSDGQTRSASPTATDDACEPDWGPNGLIAYVGGCDQAQTTSSSAIRSECSSIS